MKDTTFRTNYFAVKNPKAFEMFMKSAGFTHETHTLWCSQTPDGSVYYAFGAEGTPIDDMVCLKQYRKCDCPQDEYYAPFNLFIEDLQKHISDDDCVVIQSVHRAFGNDKHPITNIDADAWIVTPTNVKLVDFFLLLQQQISTIMGRDYYAIFRD